MSRRARAPLGPTIVTMILIMASGSGPAATAQTPEPSMVTIAGSLQSELGCPGDWDPACSTTSLTYTVSGGVWRAAFAVPAGSYEYKAALNGSWDENYGRNGVAGGPNIQLSTPSRMVTFYYDHESHWVTDNVTSTIAVAAGSFQSELGCPGDWDPACLRSWLRDVDGDGVYSLTTTLPAGSYETKAAIDESWDVNYGVGGEPNGANVAFVVYQNGDPVEFTFDSSTNVLEVHTPVPNLLRNAGFEVDADNDERPDKWTSSVNFTRSGTSVFRGSYAGRHNSTTNSNHTTSQTISSLTAGAGYRFSGRVSIPRTNDAFSFTVRVRWLDEAGGLMGTDLVRRYSSPTKGWSRARANMTGPSGATKARIQMVSTSLDATIYVDAFSLRPN